MANHTTRITPESVDKLVTSLTARDVASVRKRIEAMEHLLEGLFTIPGTNRKIGLDVILDLIPIGGDAIGALMGAWIVWEARNLGMSKAQMARMFGNVGIDFVLGIGACRRRGARLSVPLQHAQPENHQASSRQAAPGICDHRPALVGHPDSQHPHRGPRQIFSAALPRRPPEPAAQLA